MARAMAQGPRQALASIKDNLDEALHIDFDAALRQEARRLVACSATEDHREAVRAFIEKRPPVFTGR
jgi:2-(1,2-epoxy-1,2-dihydrophenyl)acetyl-CoA isomerase